MKKHECAVCTDTFSNVEAVIHHILRVHNLVDPATLAATEAGNQLVNVWPVEVTHNFKWYDCGKDVGERANLIQHKKEEHYKMKNCTSFHQNNYCRFSAEDCIYNHRPEEKQWQGARQAGDQQGGQGHRQSGGQGDSVCRNGPGCYWLANKRCRFRHEAVTVQSVATPPKNIVISATPNSNTNTTSGATIETVMQTIMDRLEQLELRMPPIRNIAGFPPMEGGKKSQ